MTTHFRVTARAIDRARLLLPTLDDRYLPEGIQPVGRGYLGFVLIQRGRASKSGELCFFHPESGDGSRVSLPGRPGFFRPLRDDPHRFLIGLEHQLAIATIDRSTGLAELQPLATIPDDLIPTGLVTVMANDGIVDPTGRRIFLGCKDFHFGAEGHAGVFLCYADSKMTLVRGGEICPNGNVFINGPTGCRLLHIETASQTIYAMDYDLGTGRVGRPVALFSFRDRTAFPPEIFHNQLMPDGMTGFEADGGFRLIVAIFDPRPEATIGRAVQLRVEDRGLVYEGCYETPGSPRVTCPTIMRHPTSGAHTLYLTTADEGYIDGRCGTLDQYPDVGNLFEAAGDQLGTGVFVEQPARYVTA